MALGEESELLLRRIVSDAFHIKPLPSAYQLICLTPTFFLLERALDSEGRRELGAQASESESTGVN